MQSDARANSIFVVTLIVVMFFSCGSSAEEETKYIEFLGMRLGEVWSGPEVKLYSQSNEELIIRDFFEDRTGGIFLDVGSSTPIENSTTYYLEKHLDWSGIAIDALRHHAPAYRKERPRTKFFSYFVTDHSRTRQEFYLVLGSDALSSGDKDAPMIKDKKKVKLIVPTITLNDLLKQIGVTSIDFMSMDIEGGAPKALAGFDIEKYRPQLVCIEKGGQEEFIQSYFTDHHYERIEKYRRYDYVNWYYAPIGDERADADE
jgi:hypothetical protein